MIGEMKSSSLILIMAAACGVAVGDVCSSPGRLPDPSVPDCRGYIMCIAAGTEGVYAQYNLTCPMDFVFNALDGVCANPDNYDCAAHKSDYNCLEPGSYKDPTSSDCAHYVLCKHFSDTVVYPVRLECPNGTLFDDINSSCMDQDAVVCTRVQGSHSDANVVMMSIFFIALSLFVSLTQL